MSREVKLKKENDELRERLEALEQSLRDLQQEKAAADNLIEQMLDSRPPTAMQDGGSRSPEGPCERKPNLKRHPKRSPPHKRLKVPVMEEEQIQYVDAALEKLVHNRCTVNDPPDPGLSSILEMLSQVQKNQGRLNMEEKT